MSDFFDWSSYDTSPDYTDEFMNYSVPTPDVSQGVSGFGGAYPTAGTLGAPGAGGGAQPSMMQSILGAIAGAAPGGLSIIGQLLGNRAGTSPNMLTAQKALGTQAQGALSYMQPGANQLFGTGTSLLNQLGQGQNPLQQGQNSILSALAPTAANLASGNMQIPPALQALVQQAYQPYIANIDQQAIETARNQGFAGGADLLGTGKGTALAGPALANAAGMEAQSLLQAMTQFPQAAASIAGSYNQPINQLTGIANNAMAPQAAQAAGYSGLFGSYPSGTNYNQALGAGIGQAAGNALAGGLYGGALPGQQQQNQQYQNSLLNALNPQMPNAGSLYG